MSSSLTSNKSWPLQIPNTGKGERLYVFCKTNFHNCLCDFYGPRTSASAAALVRLWVWEYEVLPKGPKANWYRCSYYLEIVKRRGHEANNLFVGDSLFVGVSRLTSRVLSNKALSVLLEKRTRLTPTGALAGQPLL